jgi:hypothetical protein
MHERNRLAGEGADSEKEAKKVKGQDGDGEV